MSNRFHNKWHRHNHHTDPHPGEPDSSHDPIASHEDPFKGDFVVNTGTVSAIDPQNAGWFYTPNTVNGMSLYSVNDYKYNLINTFPYYPVAINPPNFNAGLAANFAGNVVVENALSANSIWSDYLSSTYADVDIINVHVSELDGYTISGHYYDLKPEYFDCSNNIGIAPYEALLLDGTALSGNTWAAFRGDLITHRDAYVKDRLITNDVSGCKGTEITVHSNSHFLSNVRIDGNLYLSGDGYGQHDVYVGDDLYVDGFVVEPTATNMFVSGATFTDCIKSWPSNNRITIGCDNCHDDLDVYDATRDFGVKICGDLSANRIFGLLNAGQTDLIYEDITSIEDVTTDLTLWNQETLSYEVTNWWDGLVVVTTESDNAHDYAHVECYSDNNLVGQMVVGNPGNTTNNDISHPLSAERVLENKQVVTFPILGFKDWEVKLKESYGTTRHSIKVYRHTRSVNIGELWINENLYVGGSSIFVNPVQFHNHVDFDCNSAINLGSIEFCEDHNPTLDLACGELHNVRKIINNHDTCVDTIHANSNMHFDTASGIVIPVGGNDTQSPETTGAIRFNSETNSFEGHNNQVWTDISEKTIVFDDYNEFQLWFNSTYGTYTNSNIIKRGRNPERDYDMSVFIRSDNKWFTTPRKPSTVSDLGKGWNYFDLSDTNAEWTDPNPSFDNVPGSIKPMTNEFEIDWSYEQLDGGFNWPVAKPSLWEWSNARVGVNIGSGSISAINITNHGDDYQTPPIVNIDPSPIGQHAIANASITIDSLQDWIRVINGGIGLIDPHNLEYSTDGGDTWSEIPSGDVDINLVGGLDSFNFDNRGGNFQSPPDISFSDNGGGVAIAKITGGVIDGGQITDGGSNWKSLPTSGDFKYDGKDFELNPDAFGIEAGGIVNVNILSGGSYESVPDVSIPSPTGVAVNQEPAEVSTVFMNVKDFNIIDGGSGYEDGEVVDIILDLVVEGENVDLTAIVNTDTGGSITGINLLESIYDTFTTINHNTTAIGQESNADNANIEINSLEVVDININGGGSGYMEDVDITFSGGSPVGGDEAEAKGEIDVNSINLAIIDHGNLITKPGSGYTSEPLIKIQNSDGEDAWFLGSVDYTNSEISEIEILDPGSYTTSPTVNVSPTNGADITANLSSTVDSITNINHTPYTNLDEVPLVRLTSSSETQAPELRPVVNSTITVEVDSAGDGYTTPPGVDLITAPNDFGSGATASSELSEANPGQIAGANLLFEGINYNTLPDITVHSFGGGDDAELSWPNSAFIDSNGSINLGGNSIVVDYPGTNYDPQTTYVVLSPAGSEIEFNSDPTQNLENLIKAKELFPHAYFLVRNSYGKTKIINPYNKNGINLVRGVHKDYVDHEYVLGSDGQWNPSVPVGGIMMWYGDIPQQCIDGAIELPKARGWLVAAGQSINRHMYPKLWDMLDAGSGNQTGTPNKNLPDLRSRFSIGYDPNDSEYDAIGKTGGGGNRNDGKSIRLDENNMPSHNHSGSITGGISVGSGGSGHSHSYRFGNRTVRYYNSGTLYNARLVDGTNNVKSTDGGGGSHTHSASHNLSVSINSQGSNTPFEIRSPYITMAYIIKAR